MLIFLCVASLATARVPALSAERTDFLVNDDGGPAQQTHPRIAVGPDRSFAIVWADKRSGNSDIYLQRFDSDGNAVGLNLRINDDNNASWQSDPAIAAGTAGHNRLMWKDYRNGAYPFGDDLYLQELDASFLPIDNNRELTVERPDSLKEAPDLAVFPGGRAVSVWADFRDRNWNIYGQLLAADGSFAGGNFRIAGDAGDGQEHAPRVACSSDGWFVVTWYDNRQGDDNIYVRVFDSLGTPLTASIEVNSDPGTARQAFPDVAADARGRFTVVWVDWRNGSYPINPDIFSRKYSAAGLALTDDTRLNTDVSLRAQREPTIAADRQGNVAIVWSDSVGGSFDIVGQMIDADGVVRETNFRANSDADSIQVQADVALDGQFRYITWVDGRNGNLDVYASITRYNDPSLVATPGALTFTMIEGEELPEPATVEIDHAGYNSLGFKAVADVAWLEVNPVAAQTPASVNVSVTDPSLMSGSYAATLTFIDTLNYDSSLVVPVALTVEAPVLQLLEDTVWVGSASVLPQSPGVLEIELTTVRSVIACSLTLACDPEVVTIDSAIGSPYTESLLTITFDAVPDSGVLTLLVETISDEVPLPVGNHPLAHVYFTSKNIETRTIVDIAPGVEYPALLTDSNASRIVPMVIPGEIAVGLSTSVPEFPPYELPRQVVLHQNYPNPFNPTTEIAFNLPKASRVHLEVINVLGQTVAVLIDYDLPAGTHVAIWNVAHTASARASASGVYFYRLAVGSDRRVGKMLLLK
jgi:hypothetical protein